jgi:hypothetical protein
VIKKIYFQSGTNERNAGCEKTRDKEARRAGSIIGAFFYFQHCTNRVVNPHDDRTAWSTYSLSI